MSDFNKWTSYDIWKNACSQQSGCIPCPLAAAAPNGKCEELTADQIKEILEKEKKK